MSDSEKTDTKTTAIQEGYKPNSVEGRGYTPFSQQPTGQTPTFTPPPGGVGAPSYGGGSHSEPASSGGDSGGDSGGGEELETPRSRCPWRLVKFLTSHRLAPMPMFGTDIH